MTTQSTHDAPESCEISKADAERIGGQYWYERYRKAYYRQGYPYWYYCYPVEFAGSDRSAK